MCKMLLSINPEHVENILSGEKKYEFRKVKCTREIDKIVIYSTYPVKKVIGEVDVEEILFDTIDKIWNITSEFSGITKDFYDTYYKNKEKAVAFKLGKIKKYKKALTLEDLGVKCAPQSYMYI